MKKIKTLEVHIVNINNVREKIKEKPVLYNMLYPFVYLYRFMVFHIIRFMFFFTKYHSKLKKVKSIASKKRCFVIGNGPSLSIEDLEKLHTNKEICFASNGICGIFDKTEWKPNVYAIHDNEAFEMVQDHLPIIIEKCGYIFLAYNLMRKNKNYMDLKDQNNIFPFFFNQFPRKVNKKYISFSHDISKFIGDGCTVTCTLLQIAMYMGYKEIYLLGIDHNYNFSTNADGELDCTSDHFEGSKNPDKPHKFSQHDIDIFECSTKGYALCKGEGQKCSVRIYNATRGGKLEVFERVNFDDLFKE